MPGTQTIEDEQKPFVLLLDYDRAADALSMTVQALRDLVYKGMGPARTFVGNKPYFAPEDLLAWRASLRRDPPKVPQTVSSVATRTDVPTAPMPTLRRRRGRPTKAEQLARAQAMGLRS